MNPAREMASIFTANCSAAGFASSSGANLEQAKMMKILLNPVHVTPSTGGDGDAGRMKDDENDSKSASESQEHEGGSGDEEEDFNHHQRLGKKRYHRHTQEQIQAMEAFFKECPHPDDKQRKELSRELGLEPLQVKFWFQNKRTQLKMHHERFENTQLRNKNEKLRAENMQYKELLRNASCRSCGGPTALCQVSFNEHHLRIENARLRQEIDRISDLAAKYVGKPPSDEEILPPGSPRTYEPADHEDKLMIAELAVAAMEELTAMAQMGDPLWLTGNDNRTYMLNEAEYLRTFPRAIGVRPHGFKCEASRETAVVMMNHTKIVEILMDENQWSTVFSGIISGALTLEILSPGVGGSYNGALQVITAEFQVLSPLVPTRETYFLRYCKNHGNGTWAVVDVSLDSLRVSSSVKCQRRPSGCLIQEMPNGYSKVTWVEHVEVDDEGVHNIYRPLVNSGLAFGAKRWLSTLDRQCERLANAMAPNLSPSDFAITSREGRRGVLKLAERMVMSFCGGVGHTTAHTWTILTGSGADDVRVMTRRSVDDPGRPHGIALSAATSLWLPAPPKQVFDFLRDERSRNEWDILSNGGVIQEIAHIANGRRTGNCISLLRVNTGGGDQSNMLILQESCIDLTGSFVIYAPVDVTAMNKVLDGGDPDYVALLPSGFVILPDGPIRHGGGVGNNGPGGSLLTVAFQILVDTAPDAEISLASVATVNNLIACTAERIKATVAGENA